MAFTRVPGFLPSQSGFHFSNSYPTGTPYPAVTLPIVGTILAGDAGNGLCGGFVMAALDLFLHNPRLAPPPDTEKPPPGSPIFNYISDRLLDSFGEVSQGAFGNALRVIEWIRTPDVDGVLGLGLSRRVATQEWPKIMTDIDSGKPSPLSLVMGPERGLPDIDGTIATLHNCHQVLAYGYELDAAKNLTLLVYDCNDPMNDNATISLNISNPSLPIPISAPSISSHLHNATIRAFFRPDYRLHDPTTIVTGPTSSWLNMDKPQGPNIRGLMGAVTVKDTPNSPQRAHVFVEGNDFNLWCRYSTGVGWSWTQMGKPPTANIIGLAGAVTVMDTPNSAQRAHVFVAGSDGNLWCRWSSGAAWSWLNMEKPPGPNIRGLLGAVTVMDTPNSPQRPHVFVEGNDFNVWCRYSTGVGWAWAKMGKPQTANVIGPVGAVTVMDTPGSAQRAHVFVAGNDGNLWCLWSSGAAWSWLNMGKPPGPNIRGLLGAVTVMDTTSAPQRAHVFVEGDDFNVWCRYSTGVDWAWVKMGKPATANVIGLVGAVTVMDTPTSAQRAHVFVAGSDGNLWCLWSSGAAWSWLSLGRPQTANIRGLLGAVTVMDTPTSHQRPHVFVEGNDGNLWVNWRG